MYRVPRSVSGKLMDLTEILHINLQMIFGRECCYVTALAFRFVRREDKF